MKTKIKEDYKAALLAKDTVKKTTLSLLISEIDNEAISLKRELTNDEITKIVTKEVKKRNQAIDAFTIAKRFELVEKEEKEIEILKEYMPKPLSEDKILDAISKLLIDDPNMHDGKILGAINKLCGGANTIDQIKRLISESKNP